jgi:uncharacterized membrane protein
MPNTTALKSIDILAIIIAIQIALDITIVLDIPVARQVIGFVYFTFIPGYILVKLLRLDNNSALETGLLSAGLSLGLVLACGLLINFYDPILNIDKPLSVTPIAITFNIFVVLGAGLVALRKNNNGFKFEIGKKNLLVLIPILCLPLLSIVGALYENLYHINSLLMLLFILILILFAIFAFKKSVKNIYPILIFIIAISLLFHYSLISNFAHGNDTPAEVFCMSNTQTNGIWNQTGPYPNNSYWGRLNSMLSITILPTIYSSELNASVTSTYLIVFPLLFVLVPLILYLIWQQYIDKKYAFIAAFLFLAEPTFYTEMLGLTRQMMGEIFFCLLLFIILKKEIRNYQKVICFTIFSFGIVVSHYALAEIFFFFILAAFVVTQITERFSKKLSFNISYSLILLFFVIMFSWYLFTSSSSVLDSFMEFGERVVNQLGDFANPASRGESVMLGLGLSTPATVWNLISRIFAYLTEAFIVIGFIGLIFKKVKNNYNRNFTLLTSFAIVLLAALIVVPGLASTMNMSRFYHILLFLLAPLSVLGALFISKLIYKHKTEILALILLVTVVGSYFIFQAGFVYELTGSESYSLPLNYHRYGLRLYTEGGVLSQQDVNSAQWLTQHYDESSQVYSGYLTPLIGYGAINYTRLLSLTNVTQVRAGDYVYLGTLNINYKLVLGNSVWNTSSIVNSSLYSSSIIYSNGDCEVYKNTNSP